MRFVLSQGWRRDAACAGTDPELFHHKGLDEQRAAKMICGNCEVKQECLREALVHEDPFGVWGGLTPKERDRLRRPSARASA